MSDSYAIARSRVQRKALRRPPPWRSVLPWWFSACFAAFSAFAYGVQAWRGTLDPGYALFVFIYGRNAWAYWQWRRWSRSTGSKAPLVPTPLPLQTVALRYGLTALAAWVAITGFFNPGV